MATSVWPLVTVDIDGTLTTVHGWRAIAGALGRADAYDRSTRRFFAKEIGEDEHLEDMLAVATGTTLATIESALAATPRIGGIAEAIRAFHARGTRVALLTHNPAYICEWYCRTFGFDDYEGTPGQDVVDGVVGPPHGIRADKKSGLEALVSRYETSSRHVVHIGDGWADAVLFPIVGRGVALNSHLPDVERAADLALRTNDFRDVEVAVQALGPRT